MVTVIFLSDSKLYNRYTVLPKVGDGYTRTKNVT